MRHSSVFQEEHIPSRRERIWEQFRRSPVSMAALWFLVVLCLLIPTGHLLAPSDPMQADDMARLLPPLWDEQGQLSHVLGTDYAGRDMLSRLLHGIGYTFGNALFLAIVTSLIGALIGFAAAISRGVKASVLSHLLDVIMVIPSLLLALIIVALIGPGLSNTLWAVALVLIPQFTHTVYTAARSEFSKAYVTAARLDGASQWQLLWREIRPNIIDTLAMRFSLSLSTAILDISALGFLGLGAQAPLPEWGAMIASSTDLFYSAPWTVTLPGIALFLSMLSVNVVGESVSRALKTESEY